jgi:hypothetical protein
VSRPRNLPAGSHGAARLEGYLGDNRIIPELESREELWLGHDSSTNTMIRHYRKLKEVTQ